MSEVSSGVAERAKEGVLDCRKRVNRIIGEGLNRVLAKEAAAQRTRSIHLAIRPTKTPQDCDSLLRFFTLIQHPAYAVPSVVGRGGLPSSLAIRTKL